jgi:hypothetical protein
MIPSKPSIEGAWGERINSISLQGYTMSHTEDMRKLIKLLEASEPYVGPDKYLLDPDVEYSAEGKKKGEINKVVARLKSIASGRYTRLANNVRRIGELQTEIEKLDQEAKEDAREAIADLFHAKDSIYTRVVETVSFVIKLTADPKPTTTVKYEKVLTDLEQHLTPQLRVILEDLKVKYSTETTKAAALTIQGPGPKKKVEESFENDPFAAYLNKIENWARKYDQVLDSLENEVFN